MTLHCDRKPECLEKTHAGRGWTCKLWKALPGLSYRGATVLSTGSPCCPHLHQDSRHPSCVISYIFGKCANWVFEKKNPIYNNYILVRNQFISMGSKWSVDLITKWSKSAPRICIQLWLILTPTLEETKRTEEFKMKGFLPYIIHAFFTCFWKKLGEAKGHYEDIQQERLLWWSLHSHRLWYDSHPCPLPSL